MSFLDRFRKKEEQKILEDKSTASVEKQKIEKSVSATAQKSEKKEKKAVSAKKRTAVRSTYTVIKKPIITEKATVNGTYMFEVAPSATKAEVKKAIISVYGVTPKQVRMMKVKGKQVRWNYRMGKRKDWKKAIVQLKQGEIINVYEGV